MPNKETLDSIYIEMANSWASLSKAERKKVGCLIVKDGMIISDGYNGTPSGFDNKCEDVDYFNQLITRKEVLHAESNAIEKEHILKAIKLNTLTARRRLTLRQ